MRNLVLAVLLVLLSQPVQAMTVEVLYENCKPLAQRGFELADADDVVAIFKDASCEGYMLATIEQLGDICNGYRYLKKEYQDDAGLQDLIGNIGAFVGNHGTSATVKNMNAAIQLFINYAEENPQDWQYTPRGRDWLTKAFPCD